MAFIGSNVTVTSGGSVNVQAKSLVSYNGIVGGLTAGVVGLGASVDIANIQGNTQAYIDSSTTVNAGGNVTVGADARHRRLERYWHSRAWRRSSALAPRLSTSRTPVPSRLP